MPTYQYACAACGHQVEAVQAFTDEPLTVCPECDGQLRKVFSAVGVVFKGSGFYRNDSRASATTSESSSAKDTKSSESTSSSTSGSESSSTAAKSTESKGSSKKSSDASSSKVA